MDHELPKAAAVALLLTATACETPDQSAGFSGASYTYETPTRSSPVSVPSSSTPTIEFPVEPTIEFPVEPP